MLRGSWISSMLKYNYLHFILYAASLLLIPILLGIIAAQPFNVYPFLGIAVANLMILCKYIQRIKIEDDDIVVKKVFKKECIAYNEIRNIVIEKDKFFFSPTILLRINTKAKRITLHIGTLPYNQCQNVVELLKNKVKLIY